MINGIHRLLRESKVFFVLWCMIAAFGAYFCVYAFRKPFTAGTYDGLAVFDLSYKSVLIISQVIGYMCSKFIGIKVISELKAQQRQVLIIGLVLFAQLALVFFGLVAAPYNVFFLFLNGMPLGMIWGVVFSYLEGRKFTEILAMGLAISLIVSSGYLKTIYFEIHELFPILTEFWLPAIIGLVFLPVFLFFCWMLSMIPPPSVADQQLRSKRLPMTNGDKKKVLVQYGWGIAALVGIYILLALTRDFRDNFTVEIWNEISPGWTKSVFSVTETVSGIIVLIATASLVLIKDNARGFLVSQMLIAAGLILCGICTILFYTKALSPFWWMMFSGVGMFMAYTTIQVAVFERMIAHFRIKANAGFFIYICDATGYLGSVLVLLSKEFFSKKSAWSDTLVFLCMLLSSLGLIFWIASFLYFRKNVKMNAPDKIQAPLIA